MTKISGYKGDPENVLRNRRSGLMTYIFGEDRNRKLTSEEFKRIQRELIRDVLYLEFTRYEVDPKFMTIQERDFCEHLLYNANMPTKKKLKLLNRVEKKFIKTQGVTFEEFKNFYYVLFGGADLERALFFLDSENKGVTKEEFSNIAKWVAKREVTNHIIDVLFTLLDDDDDGHLTIKEFQPVLFHWRHARGFQRASLQISLGNLTI